MNKITKSKIHLLEPAFQIYFDQLLTSSDLHSDIDELVKVADVYLFSGIIRDFFTGNIYSERDLDIVIAVKDSKSTSSTLPLLRHFARIKKNSFGGLKIFTKNQDRIKVIDLWQISETKYIKDNGLEGTVDSLLESPFYNFSAIVYDYKRRKFILSDRFVEFCNTNTMEVVNTDNSNTPLCIVNSIYYSLMYGFKIGNTLKKWIIQHYNVLYDFEKIQLIHFGEVHYNNGTIREIIRTLESSNTKQS